MSDFLIIKGDTLEEIAQAIREKTGNTDEIKVTDFSSEILDIQSTVNMNTEISLPVDITLNVTALKGGN